MLAPGCLHRTPCLPPAACCDFVLAWAAYMCVLWDSRRVPLDVGILAALYFAFAALAIALLQVPKCFHHGIVLLTDADAAIGLAHHHRDCLSSAHACMGPYFQALLIPPGRG